MIGMILLAVLAVMIFFGITAGFFEKMGVANWVAFLVVLAFAVAAVFPPLITGTNVSFSYAGFFLPLLLGTVTLFALGANSALLRAIVGAMAVAGIVLAAKVAIPPVGAYRAAVPSVLIVGTVAGVVSCVIGQSRLATLSAVLCGIVLGDFISALLFRFATGATGNILALGQNGTFDMIVMTAIVGGITQEIAALVRRAAVRRAGVSNTTSVSVAPIEAAEDTDIGKETFGDPKEDDDLFDEYFNDDID